MPFDATITKVIEAADQLPNVVKDWALPAAGAVAVIVGANVVYNATRKERRPPVVWSWIPWVGSYWEIEKDPDAFFTKISKQYPGGIVGVKTTGQTFYYVTTPQLISQIHKQPKIFSISTQQEEWRKNVFSLSDKVRRAGVHIKELYPTFLRGLSQKAMMDLLQAYDDQLQEAVKAYRPPAESVSLTELILDFTHYATGRALFGPTFDYMGQREDFEHFDDDVWKVALGYPNKLLPVFVKHRTGLLQQIMDYLDSPHEASEIIATQERICREENLDKQDMASVLLARWWPLMANVPWSSVWTLLLQLPSKESFGPIIKEMDEAGAAFMAANPQLKGIYTNHLTAFFQSNPSIPMYDSTFKEVLRWSSDPYSMRGVIVDEATIGGYDFKKGETLVCRIRGIHMDPEQYERPTEYIPTRFINEQEGTVPKWMPYGGGASLCPGRFLAAYHSKIMIMTLIKNFKFEVDYSKSMLPLTLGPINRGFGLRRPAGDVYVKVSRG